MSEECGFIGVEGCEGGSGSKKIIATFLPDVQPGLTSLIPASLCYPIPCPPGFSTSYLLP